MKFWHILTIAAVTMIIISCSKATVTNAENSRSLLGKWVNIVDSLYSVSVNLNPITNHYDTSYTLVPITNHYWDTLHFIDTVRVITGTLHDTLTYAQTTDSTIRFKGYEDHQWYGENTMSYRRNADTLRLDDFVYIKAQ